MKFWRKIVSFFAGRRIPVNISIEEKTIYGNKTADGVFYIGTTDKGPNCPPIKITNEEGFLKVYGE